MCCVVSAGLRVCYKLKTSREAFGALLEVGTPARSVFGVSCLLCPSAT